MTLLQALGAFRLYGADVLLLALGITLLVSLLKRTIMKRCPRKVFVLLPFALGVLFYAVYRAVMTLSPAPFLQDILFTLEGGFGCGCASTLYYVAYEQFVRGKGLSPLYPLLEGLVPDGNREAAAEALYEAYLPEPAESAAERLKDVLRTFADPPLGEEELALYAKLLAAVCASLKRA